MTYFDKFSQSNDNIIKQTAVLLEQITAKYKSNAITLSEYKELCNNILDYDKVSANITDLVRKQVIAGAFQSLISIVGSIVGL